jgi:hypothetical protein
LRRKSKKIKPLRKKKNSGIGLIKRKRFSMMAKRSHMQFKLETLIIDTRIDYPCTKLNLWKMNLTSGKKIGREVLVRLEENKVV